MATNRNTVVSDIEDQVRIKTGTRNVWWASPALYLSIINQCTSDIARKLIDQANQYYKKKSGSLTITFTSTPTVVPQATFSVTGTAVTGCSGVLASHVGGKFVGKDSGGNSFVRTISAYVSTSAFTIDSAPAANGSGTIGYIVPPGTASTVATAAIGTLAYHKMIRCEGDVNADVPLVDVETLKRAAKFTSMYSGSVLAAHEGENILYLAGSDATADTALIIHYIAQPTYATARTDKPDLPDEYIQTLIDAVTEEINKYRIMIEQPAPTQDVAQDVQQTQQAGALENQESK